MNLGPSGSPCIDMVSAFKCFRMDCETPVSLYLKLAQANDYAFLLESVEQGQNAVHYSFIGWEPLLRVTYFPGWLVVDGALQEKVRTLDPFSHVKRILSQIRLEEGPDIPNARGGLVGYFGYDIVHLLENIGDLEAFPPDEPLFDLILPKFLFVYNHREHMVTAICHSQIGSFNQAEARDEADESIKRLIDSLNHGKAMKPVLQSGGAKPDLGTWQANLDRDAYCKAVAKAKTHIFEGDIFQVVLSRALRKPFQGDPFEVYRCLRQLNPSPYMYYLSYAGRAIVGSSPESLVNVMDGKMVTKPIAGTRPRGATTQEDLALETELLADEKEIAEHIMLVDLGRNDLGRIAEIGSVHVPKFKTIERYSHVMHIVSEVEANLRKDCSALDALLSVFPAGTLSGAPKIRAMQIIHDFEPEPRGIYGGAIGFMDFAGNMETCIAIRTAVIEGGQARVQAGAGIVADSIPQKEYEETNHKMMSILTALEMAGA